MEKSLIKRLCDLNTCFYQSMAESFASTRHNSWPGWDKLAQIIQEKFETNGNKTIRVADLACGNLRFETYLESRLEQAAFEFVAIDNCDAFPEMGPKSPVEFRDVDLIEALMEKRLAQSACPVPVDVAVSFGFAHHIPGMELRRAFMQEILRCVRPGGIACISFWSFAQENTMAHKAQTTTEEALKHLELPQLEPGDHILGWQNEPETYRYCHSFDGEEVSELLKEIQEEAVLLDRYASDGRTGKMNEYLILQRR